MVNTFQRDAYLVADRVVRGWVLRAGGQTTKLHNDGFKLAEPGPFSPKPRPSRKFGLFRR